MQLPDDPAAVLANLYPGGAAAEKAAGVSPRAQ